MSHSTHRWRLLLEDFRTDEIPASEHHFVGNVLRLRQHDEVEWTDGQGNYGVAVIKSITKKSTFIEITNHEYSPKIQPQSSLLVGLPKQPAVEETITLCSELGLNSLFFVRVEHTQNKGNVDIEKLRRKAFEALRISKLNWRMNVEIFSSLQDFFSSPVATQIHWSLADERALSEPNSDKNLNKKLFSLENQKNQQNLGVIIGPESSFSKVEWEVLYAKFDSSVLLGSGILRVPMACAYATVLMSLLQSRPK